MATQRLLMGAMTRHELVAISTSRQLYATIHHHNGSHPRRPLTEQPTDKHTTRTRTRARETNKKGPVRTWHKMSPWYGAALAERVWTGGPLRATRPLRSTTQSDCRPPGQRDCLVTRANAPRTGAHPDTVGVWAMSRITSCTTTRSPAAPVRIDQFWVMDNKTSNYVPASEGLSSSVQTYTSMGEMETITDDETPQWH